MDFLLTLNLRWATLLLALIKLLRHSLSLINPGEVSDYPVEVPKSPWLLLYFFNNKVITELHTPCSPHVSPSCKLINFLFLPWQFVFIFACPKSIFFKTIYGLLFLSHHSTEGYQVVQLSTASFSISLFYPQCLALVLARLYFVLFFHAVHFLLSLLLLPWNLQNLNVSQNKVDPQASVAIVLLQVI